MKNNNKIYIKSLAVTFVMALLFSCDGGINKVAKITKTDFVANGEADEVNLKYTDSGVVKSILTAPKMKDYATVSNPFVEFPNGLKVVFFGDDNSKTTIVANYGINYKRSNLIDLQGDVVITADDGKKFMTSQLYFNQKENWFFTEKQFKFSDAKGNFMEGPGVDFSKDFRVFNMQTNSGELKSESDSGK